MATGNTRHYPKRSRVGVTVLSPREFIELLRRVVIAASRRAATGVHRFLRGESLDWEAASSRWISLEDVEIGRFRKRDRQKMPCLPVEQRANGFEEVETGFSELMALREADRCLRCGLFPSRPSAARQG